MKLLIKDTFILDDVHLPTVNPEDDQDSVDEFNLIRTICDTYGVHHMIDLREDSNIMHIYPQIVELDEVCMNDLFSKVLYLFHYRLSYANLGGHACGIALNLKKAEL